MHESKRFILKRKNFFIRAAALVIPLVCMLLLLSQTVFAQNTYVITDGTRVLVYTTFATDPATVLGEAGLKLGEDDTYTTQESDGVSEITVQRGQTEEPDVAVLLSSTTVQMEETYTQIIPHETTYCNDPSLPKGTQKVLTPGENGQMLCTATVVYKDGAEQSRTVLEQKVLQQPVDEVIAVGTGALENYGDVIIGDGVIVTETGEVLTYVDTIQVEATAYTKTDEGCDDWTATGTWARVGAIAVDPRLIPYGTRMFIVSNDGQYVYGIATAEDCGGAIEGHRVDLYYDTKTECFRFGRRDCTIYILG